MKNLMLFILLIIGNIIYAQDSIKTQTPILDKTEHLVDKYSSKIADTFISTMESAKPFVKESFQTVVMLQIAKGIGYLLPLVFFFIFFNLMINEYKRIDNILKGDNIPEHMNIRCGPTDEWNITPIFILYLIFSSILFLISLVYTFDGITHIIAPKWFAIKEIIELLK